MQRGVFSSNADQIFPPSQGANVKSGMQSGFDPPERSNVNRAPGYYWWISLRNVRTERVDRRKNGFAVEGNGERTRDLLHRFDLMPDSNPLPFQSPDLMKEQ
jgi:hypothetical protein